MHLWTGQLWRKNVYGVQKEKFTKLFDKYGEDFIWTLKEDWYDLDMLYLEKNPEFRAFSIYEKATTFRNTYMEEFAEDAFRNRQEYIVSFYRREKEGIHREYKYMTEEEMNKFVDNASQILIEKVRNLLRL